MKRIILDKYMKSTYAMINYTRLNNDAMWRVEKKGIFCNGNFDNFATHNSSLKLFFLFTVCGMAYIRFMHIFVDFFRRKRKTCNIKIKFYIKFIVKLNDYNVKRLKRKKVTNKISSSFLFFSHSFFLFYLINIRKKIIFFQNVCKCYKKLYKIK